MAECVTCALFSEKLDGQELASAGYVQRWKVSLAYIETRHGVFTGHAANLSWGSTHSEICLRHLQSAGWPRDQLRDVVRILVESEVLV